jgi:alkylation response protein AidB-like acyl-CoA dehydrogenase
MKTVTTPDDPALEELCVHLRAFAPGLEVPGAFPQEQLRRCAAAGVFRWFLGPEWGGLDWNEADLARGYLKLSAACLTTAFVITQRMGAVSRIAACGNEPLRQELLPPLVAGQSLATVGISHLTTSRQHLARPVLSADETSDGFTLDGYSPWVTGADHAQHVVVGATLADGRQILAAVPTKLPGVFVEKALDLVALTASRTGSVRFERVQVDRRWLMAGPVHEVMKQGLAAKTGGLQTSALALGLASAALADLETQSQSRSAFADPADALRADLAQAMADLLALAEGNAACTSDELRTRANSLALRATQANLAATKGAGFVAGHSAGRWCREALFFLVWSCPQNVVAANLCELAGLSA